MIIVAVNAVGGLIIGMGQRGMSLDEALGVYTVLTVGDGLVTQLPSVLTATAAAVVATRVATPDTPRLGQAIFAQLLGDGRAGTVTGLSCVTRPDARTAHPPPLARWRCRYHGVFHVGPGREHAGPAWMATPARGRPGRHVFIPLRPMLLLNTKAKRSSSVPGGSCPTNTGSPCPTSTTAPMLTT